MRKSERLTQLYRYIVGHESSVEKHIRLALWKWHATPTNVFIVMNMQTHKIDWMYTTDGKLDDDWYVLLHFDNENGESGPLPGLVREWYRETPKTCFCGMLDKLAEDIKNASDEEAYDDWLAEQIDTSDCF